MNKIDWNRVGYVIIIMRIRVRSEEWLRSSKGGVASGFFTDHCFIL